MSAALCGTAATLIWQRPLRPPDASERLAVQTYASTQSPLVTVLTPAPLTSGHNPLTRLCEIITGIQRDGQRHFLCEQFQDQQSSLADFPQISLSTSAGTTILYASHELLLRPLKHLPPENSPGRSASKPGPNLPGPFSVPYAKSRTWAPGLRRGISDGLCLLSTAHALQTSCTQQMFPTVETGTEAPDEEPGSEWWRKCPGCRGRQARWDDRHNRVPGQCKYPEDESVTWNCPACKAHRPRGHGTHTFGPDCKHAIIAERLGTPRKGAHPRPIAKKAVDDPTKDLQAQLPDSSDLWGP